MDSPRIWVIITVAALGVVASGAALGRFATGSDAIGFYQSSRWASDRPIGRDVGNPDARYPDAPGSEGPAAAPFFTSPFEPIVCKGCGPGIEERQADFAFGYDDRTVDEYLEREATYRGEELPAFESDIARPPPDLAREDRARRSPDLAEEAVGVDAGAVRRPEPVWKDGSFRRSSMPPQVDPAPPGPPPVAVHRGADRRNAARPRWADDAPPYLPIES